MLALPRPPSLGVCGSNLVRLALAMDSAAVSTTALATISLGFERNAAFGAYGFTHKAVRRRQRLSWQSKLKHWLSGVRLSLVGLAWLGAILIAVARRFVGAASYPRNTKPADPIWLAGYSRRITSLWI